MARRYIVGGLLVAAALVFGVLRMDGLGADEGGGIDWVAGLEAAQQAAERSGKPLFLVFRCVP